MGVIGDRDSILAFKALGMEVFDAHTGQEAGQVLRRLIKEDFAVVLITEELAAENAELIKKYKPLAYPAIIPVPGIYGTNGFGMEGIRQDVEKAIGADILFNK
jgi:V/A-type H+-transporting ATPase subunit F